MQGGAGGGGGVRRGRGRGRRKEVEVKGEKIIKERRKERRGQAYKDEKHKPNPPVYVRNSLLLPSCYVPPALLIPPLSPPFRASPKILPSFLTSLDSKHPRTPFFFISSLSIHNSLHFLCRPFVLKISTNV